MIRINIPGFSNSDSGGPRWGDATIVDDGTNYVVIDGYCGVGKRKLIARLKKIQCKSPYLYISHAHGDHDEGIMAIIDDSYFSPKGLYCYDPSSLSGGFKCGEVKSDAAYLQKIIGKAKAKHIPVKFLKHGDHQKHGDIEFYVYRKQPAYEGTGADPHGWAYINDGSLCFWFPNIKYWTSGDGPERIYDMCKEVGAKPVFFKLPHHGNNCPRSQSEGMKSIGAKYCWDNDYSTTITDFLQYGRGRAIEAGLKYFGIHGDINVIAQSGYVSIYKDYKVYRYKCAYSGKTALKQPTLAAVEGVLNGDYGNNNTRITNLIDAGFYPIAVQNHINKMLKLLGR